MDKFKRIVCLIGVVLLVGIYIVAFLSALFYQKGAQHIFTAAIYSTFVIPAFIYAMMLVYRVLGGNKKDDE
ncbi:MAG: hypothetical protein IKN54_00200 [Lachnospiraceae bacterium]|nr:hypothetical protein [Lachnospiraceae bacterium]